MLARSCFILLSLFTISAWAQPPMLADQYGKSSGLEDYAGQPVLVIVASGRKLRHVKGWEEGLRKDYPQLLSLRIADIIDTPRPTYEQVAKKLFTFSGGVDGSHDFLLATLLCNISTYPDLYHIEYIGLVIV